MARKQKAKVVAGKSKSSKDKENSDIVDDASEDGVTAKPQSDGPESTEDEPVVIEAEAIEVTETSGEDGENTDDAPDAAAEEEPELLSGPAESAPQEVVSSTAHSEGNSGGSGASVFALVFGGLIAGAIGFFGASFAPQPEFDSSALSESIAANSTALEGISEDLSALMDAPAPELPDFASQFSEINDSIQSLGADLESVRSEMTSVADDLKSELADFDSRILALETAVPAAGGLEMGEELAALRQRIADMTAEAEEQLNAAQSEAANIARAAEEARLAAEAEAEAARAAAEAREAELAALAERQEALIDLKSAIETGAPYSDLLGRLGSVPEVLAANAEAGVPTLQSLQQAFPEVARKALAQSETVSENASAGERLTAFLKRRTNARSLTPQEGDTPDAILSRAEALLAAGDLSAALTEIEALPEAGKSAMSQWLEQAATRTQASTAVDELSATN